MATASKTFVKGLRLVYKGRIPTIPGLDIDTRLWDVVEPKLEGYPDLPGRYPTFTLNGLIERGLIS